MRCRISGRLSSTSSLSASGAPFGPGDGREGVGEHREGDVPVPAGVLTDLVVVQAGLALGGLEGLLDRPPGAGDAHQIGQAHALGSVAEVVRQLGRVGQAAAGRRPVLGVGVAFAVDAGSGPRVPTVTLGAGTGGAGAPRGRRQPLDQRLGPVLASRDRRGGLGDHALTGRHREHVAHATVLQRLAQPVVLAIDGVPGGPRRRDPAVDRAGDHLDRQLRLGRKPPVGGDRGSIAPGAVLGPGLGQVQLPVQERPTRRRGAGQEHPDLRVLDPTRRSGVLAGHPGRPVALLHKPGLVHDQDPATVAEMRDNVGAQVIAHQIRVPVGGRQQPLHRIGHRQPGLLRERPGVLPLPIRRRRAAAAPGSLGQRAWGVR